MVDAAELARINGIRAGNGLKPFTEAQYINVKAGKYNDAQLYEYAHYGTGAVAADSGISQAQQQAAKEAEAKAAQQAAAAKAARITNIDPQKTSGYSFKYAMSHSDQNAYLREKQSDPSLTEYQFRQRKGQDLEVVKGSYTKPKMTTSNKSAASTGTKQTGVSNDKTGSEKLAAQSKTNASTNKATVKSTTTTKNTTPAKKTVVSLDAAKSGNASKTSKATPTKTVVTTKQAASGNAAKTTPTTKKTVVTTKQASSGNAAKTTPTSKKTVSLDTAKNGTVAKNTASTASSGSGNVKKVNTPVSTHVQKSAIYIPVVRSATGVIISQQTTKTDPNMDRNTTGLSRKISGSEKIAAQNKTNASTNKAVILNRVEAPKTVVSIDAARRGNAAATTPKPQKVEQTTKTIVSLAAARGGNAGHGTGLSIPMTKKTEAPNLTGSQKLAAQSKINSATNKPTIIKKPVQPASVQSTPIVTKKPSFQLTPFQPNAAPIILKNPTTTPAFNTTQTATESKKSIISSLFGPDKSGFGFIGVASGKPTNEDIQKYTKDPRFKPCPTGLCKVSWRDDQIAKLKAIDMQVAQTNQKPTNQKPTNQKPSTQTTQKPPTTQKPIKPTTQLPTYVESQPESQPESQSESLPVRVREDPQWHKAVQDILKKDMMAKYNLDYRGNKITTSAGSPIQLADGSYIEQVQTQGNSRDSGVKIYTAQLTDAEKAQNQTAYEQRSVLGQKIYRDAVKVGTIQGTVENKNAAEAKAAAKAEAARIKALQAAFTGNTKIGASGEVIDAIQVKGAGSTGERGVSLRTVDKSGVVTGLSKSQSQFQSEAKYREQVASIPLQYGMTSDDINTIKQARADVQARTLSKLTYPKDDKYADPEVYAREYERIDKATKNMSMDEKRAYLKNTITTQMEGKSTTQDLVFMKGTRFEKSIPKVQAFDVINAISTKELSGEALTPAEQHFVNLGNQDYVESKPAKWINTRLNNAGEWTSQKLLAFSGGDNGKYQKGSDWAGITSNKDTQDKLASTWTSAREGFYGDSPKFLTGFGSLIVTDVDYAAQQLVNRGPITGGRNIGNKVTGDVIGILGGSVTAVKDDPTRFAAGMIGASAIHTTVKKPIVVVKKNVMDFGRATTGITRRETVIEPVTNNIPFKEAGAILDELTSGKTIRGSRGSSWTEKSSTLNTVSNQVKQLQFGKATSEILNSSKKKGEKVVGKGNYKGETYPKDPAKQKAWNYNEPGTEGKPVVFQTVREGNVNVVSERFINKGASTLTGTVINKFTNANKVAKVGETADGRIYKIRDRTAEGGERAPITLGEKVGVNVVKAADQAFGIRSTDGKIVTKVKKGIAADYTRRTLKPTPLKERRIFDQEVRSVDLSKTAEHRALQERMIKSFKETGQFVSDSQGEIYKKILDIADEQSKLYDEPIAAPSPKLANGSRAPTGLQAENEVVLVMTGPSSSIMTSRQWIGNAVDGTKIERVRYGKQTPLPKRSVVNRMFENYQYNVDINLNRMGGSVGNKSKIIKPGFYNRHHFESMLGDITRKKAELYDKTALTRPGAYTGGKHGLEHAEKVTKNMEPQRSQSGTTAEYEYYFGKYHDMAKTGAFDSARMGHGSTIYEAIKLNKIDDPWLKSLTDAERRQFAKDLGVHDFIKPMNLKNGLAGVQTKLIIKPTKGARAGANADRIELTRFNIKPDPKRMFTELLPDGSPYKPITTLTKAKRAVDTITTSPTFKTFVANEAAEFVWNRRAPRSVERTIKSDIVLDKGKYTTGDGIFGKVSKNGSYKSVIESTIRKRNGQITKTEKQSYPERKVKNETNTVSAVQYYEKPYAAKGNYKPTPFNGVGYKTADSYIKTNRKTFTKSGDKNPGYKNTDSYIKTNRKTYVKSENKNTGYKNTDSYIKTNTISYVNSDAYKPINSDIYKPTYDNYVNSDNNLYVPPYVPPYDPNDPYNPPYIPPYIPPYDPDPDPYDPNDPNDPNDPYDPDDPDDPYNPIYPVPEHYDDRYGNDGGGGDYSGFIDYHKLDPIGGDEIIKRKPKSGVYEKLPWGMANQALMISKTKVNTFDEMMGRTGKKVVQGSETKVTKQARASPFNKKVTLPTVKSFTPVALNVAQKGLERKLDVIAKTPVKYYGAVPENVKQKSATISRKPTNSKPRSQSNSVPVKQIFTPKKQVSFAKPSFNSGSNTKAVSTAKPKSNTFVKQKTTVATKRKASPWG